MCPYYAKNEDYCDVGCGYISSCDVKTIIRFCMRRHADCLKYRELTDRGIGGSPRDRRAASLPV